jgi:predicted patatin/cPLA2 family phospholipase
MTRKVALLVEGGGLRGAFAVGVLRVLLERLGATSFDGVFAVSSGVFAASYFVANQGEDMEATWRDLVCNRQLIDYWNILKREPVLKLDHLIDLFKGSVRLNLQHIYDSPAELLFVLTHWDTGAPAYFDAKRPEIFDLMRASSALPLIYNRPVIIDGQLYYDGGQSDALPIKFILDRGYDRVLVVRTRPANYRKTRRSAWGANLVLPHSREARGAWVTLYERYNDALAFAENPPNGAVIHQIAPEGLTLSRLSRDRGTIGAAIDEGKKMCSQYLETHGISLLD